MGSALDDFLSRATRFPEWITPIDANLRRAVIWSSFCLALAIPAFAIIPWLQNWPTSWFFWALELQHKGVVQFFASYRNDLIALNLAGLGLFVVSLVTTNKLQAGRIFWHRVAFAQILLGTLNIFCLIAAVWAVLVNIFIWLILVALAITLTVAILALVSM